MIIKRNKHQPANPRRSFLRMAAGFGAVTAGAGLLAACGGGGDSGEALAAGRETALNRGLGVCDSKTGAVVDGSGATIGFLDVYNDASNVYVTVFSAGSCFLGDMKLWVGTNRSLVPVDAAGVPLYAQLPLQHSAAGAAVEHRFVIPLAGLGISSASLSCANRTPVNISIVGQVSTTCGTGTVRGYEGPNGVGSAYTFMSRDLCCFDVPPVVLTGCETAFAKGGYVFVTDAKANPESLPTLGLSKNRWGWAINLRATGTTTYPIYAGAGLNNTGAGKLVGTLTVDYTGSQVTATYAMAPGAAMSEAHLYVGDSKPTTIAPGQFGNNAGFGTPATSHSVTASVSDSNGDGVWLIAHAVVCGS